MIVKTWNLDKSYHLCSDYTHAQFQVHIKRTNVKNEDVIYNFYEFLILSNTVIKALIYLKLMDSNFDIFKIQIFLNHMEKWKLIWIRACTYFFIFGHDIAFKHLWMKNIIKRVAVAPSEIRKLDKLCRFIKKRVHHKMKLFLAASLGKSLKK